MSGPFTTVMIRALRLCAAGTVLLATAIAVGAMTESAGVSDAPSTTVVTQNNIAPASPDANADAPPEPVLAGPSMSADDAARIFGKSVPLTVTTFNYMDQSISQIAYDNPVEGTLTLEGHVDKRKARTGYSGGGSEMCCVDFFERQHEVPLQLIIWRDGNAVLSRTKGRVVPKTWPVHAERVVLHVYSDSRVYLEILPLAQLPSDHGDWHFFEK